MVPESQKGFRGKLWPPRYLRYLLIWPLVTAYRRKTRTHLSWRLAGSHFATVLVSVVAICVVGVVIAVIASRLAAPADTEAAFEAFEVARIVEGLQEHNLSDADLNGIFRGVVAGEIISNTHQGDVTIQANAGMVFEHIRTVSLIDPDGVIRASSDSGLVGQEVAALDEVSRTAVHVAMTDGPDAAYTDLSVERADGSVVGAHAMWDDSGALTGITLVDKSQNSLPKGLDFVLLVLSFAAQLGIVLLILIGVPAIPIGIIFGIRRARAISRPILSLSRTATGYAAGDLSARVDVKGQDEVAALQRGFNEMADHVQATMLTEAEQRDLAEQALAANRDLIANVSHELRTPVALIRGHLEALESDPAEREAYLRIALRETDRLELLVEELFQLSRLEARQLEFDIAPFDSGSAVRSAAESLAEPARREAGLTLTTTIADDDLTALGDRMRFEQVLLNLIRNAVRFTPEGGIILLSAERLPGEIEVKIRDTGIGISAGDLPHVFERFYRADQSRARTSGGAGLGLAIAKEMIEAMGGSIAAESEPGEGTTFTIQLPAASVANGRATSVVREATAGKPG
jgi:signal transduction histidine kinase